MDITFGPVQHTEGGDRHDIIIGGTEIGLVYPDTGYACISEEGIREEVDKALKERFGKNIELLEVM